MLVVLKISRFSLNQTRLPDGNDKRSLLRAIDRARSALPLRSVLRVVRLSPARYHDWKRENQCALDDRLSCPRVFPQQLTAAEVEAIHELVISHEYRHVPTGTLALLAQRLGKVFASPSTWYRLIRDHQWRRPRHREEAAQQAGRDHHAGSQCPGGTRIVAPRTCSPRGAGAPRGCLTCACPSGGHQVIVGTSPDR